MNSTLNLNLSFILFCSIFLTIGCKVQTGADKTTSMVNPNLKNTYHINAITDYESLEVTDFVKPYIDKNRKAIAINAAQHKNKFAAATYIFQGEKGKYNLQLHTLAELDGESQYRIAINGKRLRETKTNPLINRADQNIPDYAPVMHIWYDINLQKGDQIRVESSSETNGLIPEGDITAYSRGRFTGITLIPEKKK